MASNKKKLNAVSREWLAARDVIAATILDWLPGFGSGPADDLAAAILARLAAHDPPILLDLGGIGADAVEACRAVVTTDWISIEETKSRRNALARCADVVRRADAEG